MPLVRSGVGLVLMSVLISTCCWYAYRFLHDVSRANVSETKWTVHIVSNPFMELLDLVFTALCFRIA